MKNLSPDAQFIADTVRSITEAMVKGSAMLQESNDAALVRSAHLAGVETNYECLAGVEPWFAYRDPEGIVGRGETEAAAIIDLYEQERELR